MTMVIAAVVTDYKSYQPAHVVSVTLSSVIMATANCQLPGSVTEMCGMCVWGAGEGMGDM